MESSDDNLPINDEPTRDYISLDGDGESFGFASDIDGERDEAVPDQIGDYKIRELIGSGGMGNVYLAEHTRMGRMVAIKMLPIDRMKDKVAVSRFYEEVRAASRLLHPNIVAAFDAGEDVGIHYLAMEYVDGVTLTRYVSMRGPLSVGETAAIIRQAALGLLHAHRAGIVHRDVKPGNLMRASDGTVKVLDLGLARINEAELTSASIKDGSDSGLDLLKSSKGRLVGTLPFMSPEQLEDADGADARSDIYSLGATMYFLLTASPPFVGEYLDQVYGHRHGEIPDLMQARGDVDLHFANIFCRMMAKKPAERYESLDEVIDDLSDYVSHTDAPVWLAEFSQRTVGTESSTLGRGSTFTGGSTSGSTSKVLAIDFGMFYSACASASPLGGITHLPAGGGKLPLFRMALATEGDRILYGNEAIDRRSEHPLSLLHCLPMYIGKPVVDRKVADRSCPPEVLMAMLLKKIRENVWPGDAAPQATAITVPSSYDQLHRRSILQAASMAGLPSVRLVDRSVAAVQSLLIENDEAIDKDGIRENALSHVLPDQDQMVLFVGVSGQATEVAVIRRDSTRLHPLATSGHWHQGSLPWLHRLVDLSAQAFIVSHGFDPRRSMKTAAGLQIACERAMNTMLLAGAATIRIKVGDREKMVTIERDHWLDKCEDLVAGILAAIRRACEQARVRLSDIDVCVTMGAVMRIAAVRDAVTVGLKATVERLVVDRADVARGAAACLAAELPGRGDIVMPPRGVTSQAIGIVIEDAKGRRRILPIIPKGTTLPARTNRRLTVGKVRSKMTLSLVESAGVLGDDWHALGRYEVEISEDDLSSNSKRARSRTFGFEVNVNGLLSVRVQSLGTSASTKLPPVPTPTISDESAAQWTRWIDGLR